MLAVAAGMQVGIKQLLKQVVVGQGEGMSSSSAGGGPVWVSSHLSLLLHPALGDAVTRQDVGHRGISQCWRERVTAMLVRRPRGWLMLSPLCVGFPFSLLPAVCVAVSLPVDAKQAVLAASVRRADMAFHAAITTNNR